MKKGRKRKICHDRDINLKINLFFCIVKTFRYPNKKFFFSAESELKEKVKGPTLLLTFYASFDCFCAGVFAIVISMELEIGNLYWNDNVQCSHRHTHILDLQMPVTKTFMRLFSCVWFVRQCHEHFNFSHHILSVCGSGWKCQKVQ